MKKSVLVLLICPLLFAMQCDPDDEPCGNLVELEKRDLITVENLQAEYQLNDTLWLNSTVDINQQSSSAIDLFEFDEELSFYIELKKASVYNPNNYLYLNEETTVIDKGRAIENNFILTKENNTFKNRIGIKLLEPGNYSLTIYNIASYKPSGTDCNFTSFLL
jgi:hypothetical protein